MRRMIVVGASMRPLLEPGDRVLVRRTRRLRRGDVVAVTDPRSPGRVMVKRVASLSSSTATVLGDDPEASTDSRTFGPVHRREIHGRVVYRYWPEDRRGRIRR